MKGLLHTYNRKLLFRWFTMVVLFIVLPNSYLAAQIRVPFAIRTSAASPSQTSFRVKGDFTFIGNTNLTLVNYDESFNNNNNAMQYVDVDNDPSTWNSSSADLAFSGENGAHDSCSRIVYAGLYWTGRTTADGESNSPIEFSVNKQINGTTVTKHFNKRSILLKGPQANHYTEFRAADNAIYYPTAADAFLYSAFVEVTDYVKENGLGTYFAADIALMEGNGSSTGYSGGWGLMVIYENSKMKQRDITVYDGHAFVLNAASNGYVLEVNGFKTIPAGNVGIKLGVMASEGDVGLDGDYFQIQKYSDLTFQNLSHALNTGENFFNSTNTTAMRNPFLFNNTGIDIGTFTIPNENNSVIGNNQSSTKFRYGTVGDTYAIFALVLAVDSYLPDVENTLSYNSSSASSSGENQNPVPGQEITVGVDIRNYSGESISNYKITIPIPFNAVFVPGSAAGTVYSISTATHPNNPIFDAHSGNYGSLIWNYGTLPHVANPDTILARLQFRLRVTENCYLLKNNQCDTSIQIDGSSEGTGIMSGISFSSDNFILGTISEGNCIGDPIPGPLVIPIDGANFVESQCQNANNVLNFNYCNSVTSVPLSDIISFFPPNSSFYNEYPLTANTTSYSPNASLPLVSGESLHYYAIPRNSDTDCAYPFTLSQCASINANSDTGMTIGSVSGGVVYANLLANDLLNGHAVTPEDVELSLVSTPQQGILLQGNSIVVTPGTPVGNYVLTYQICSVADTTLCQQAQVQFTVIATHLIAHDDIFKSECSAIGILGNIVHNDLLNGVPCIATQVDISIISGSLPGLIVESLTGTISLDNELPPGNYEIQYKIAPKDNPINFDIATVYLSVIDLDPPAAPLLEDLTNYCSQTVPIPTTTDSCSGSVTGYTADPLYYDLPGDYTIHWNFSDASGNSTTVDQQVFIRNSADAVPGYGYVDCNLDNDSSLNIDLNSYLPEGINRSGTWTSAIATPNLNGSVFSPYEAPTGNYEFLYLYQEDHCTQTARVLIEVNNDCYVAPACNLLVHNSFSPNNDGINEIFLIENIDQINCFPTNTVEIYNRWGVLVFKTKQYDNVTRVFKGTSEGRATVNESNQLPTGTYYYVIKYTDANAQESEASGYVYLVR